MKPTAILLPVIVQALLTFVVLVLMGPARARSMRENGQDLGDPDVRLGRNVWSEPATKLANNYKNQFELPVLFYAVVAFLLITSGVDYLAVALAWVFVLSRVAHTVVHIGPNVVMWRGAAFLVGVATLLALWVQLTLHIL